VWNWVDELCSNGSGYTSTYWYYPNSSVEWSNSNLADYELSVAGPSSGYTSSNGAGMYAYGCAASGYALARGGRWDTGNVAGIYGHNFALNPILSSSNIGFRCVLD
jgi:hypothetical protein